MSGINDVLPHDMANRLTHHHCHLANRLTHDMANNYLIIDNM